MSQEEIFVFGLGAIGSFYSFVLTEAKTRVTVCGRSNYEAVKNNGMDFTSEKFGKHPGYKFGQGEHLCFLLLFGGGLSSRLHS